MLYFNYFNNSIIMLSKIFNKYTKVELINSISNIKTYSARIEPIIKEITPKDYVEYYLIKEKLEKNKNGIYEIIGDKTKIYIVIENNGDSIKKIDKLILQNEGIFNEPENSLIDTPPIIEQIPGEIYDVPLTSGEITYTPMNPGKITNVDVTTQLFNKPIVDRGLSKPQETTSISNKLDENIISSDNRILYNPGITPGSFITKDNSPSYNTLSEIIKPINDQNIYGIPISSFENYVHHKYNVEPSLTNHFFRIKNTSTNLLNSNLKEMSVKLTPNIENKSVNPISYIEKTNVNFNETTPFPPVTDPPSKSLAPLF